MIPIEKLIPIEQKAREYGYDTEITNGGIHVKFCKYEHGGGFAVTSHYNKITLWNPANIKVSIETYNAVLDEQKNLLELAIMLQENMIEDEIEEENEDDD